MSKDERDEFLGRGGTGVISFGMGADEPPFLLPISYGYDEGLENFYFKLAFPPGSTKAKAVDKPVSFASHSRTEDGWKSVVATGTLEELTDVPNDSIAVQGMWAVDIPKVDIFEQPREDVTFADFRLVPTQMTGRKEVQTEP